MAWHLSDPVIVNNETQPSKDFRISLANAAIKLIFEDALFDFRTSILTVLCPIVAPNNETKIGLYNTHTNTKAVCLAQ